jgi:peptidyl-prolyl cis-trans isomerase A (cyclophilin A)/peptidyl-prolyl cis-trans isomerase B (cyclophilin B)
MARINLVDSATSQFFINVAENTFLDHKNETTRGYGYAVFGEVISGMEVVDRIAAVKTGTRGPFPAECPLEDIVIVSIARAN